LAQNYFFALQNLYNILFHLGIKTLSKINENNCLNTLDTDSILYKDRTMTRKGTKQDKAGQAIAAAIATIDNAPIKDSGKIESQFDHIGNALHKAALIAPLTIEILSGISELAGERKTAICTQYRDLLANAANGFTSDADKRKAEKERLDAIAEKAGNATPEQIEQALKLLAKQNANG
tara:strand:- start:543 stop:1076 length:534 start_codon:yes stop_codon:yes gene_type:complete